MKRVLNTSFSRTIPRVTLELLLCHSLHVLCLHIMLILLLGPLRFLDPGLNGSFPLDNGAAWEVALRDPNQELAH